MSTGFVTKLEALMSELGFHIEPGTVHVYVQVGCMLGLYKLACERARLYPLALRLIFPFLYCSVFMLTPAITILGWLCRGYIKELFLSWIGFARKADCVNGGPPTKIGYFRWNGKDFVRHQDLSTSRVRLTGGVTTVYGDGVESTSSRWEIIEPTVPADFSPGECALAGLASTARPAFLEKGQVLVYDSVMNLFSSATVVNNILIMCRHKTAGLTHIVVKGTNVQAGASRQSGVRIGLDRACYLDSHGAPSWDEKRHTCTFLDFLAIPLHKDEISMIGVKTYKDKDLTRNYELQRGTITYSNDDFGSIVKEEGSIPESDLKIHNLGLALAYIVSQPGASSSGVGVVQNGQKLAGMWLGMPAHSLRKHRGTMNLFMHTDAIMANLEQLGLVKSPLLERIRQWGDSLSPNGIDAHPISGPTQSVPSGASPGESRETKKERATRHWNEYYKTLEEEDYEYGSEDAEEDNARVHGTAGIDYKHADPGQAVGHARREVAKPLIKLPSSVAAPTLPPPLRAPPPGESVALEVLKIAVEHNKLDLDSKVKSWKYGILVGDAPRVLREIAYYVDEASGDVRERLNAVLAVPSNALLRDYMQKTTPEWSEGQDGEEIPDMNGNGYFRRVGSCEPPKPMKPKKLREEETELQQRLRALAQRYFEGGLHGCTKGEYKVPVCSKKNIDKSLRAQARLATASAPALNSEQQEEFAAAVQLVRDKYSAGIGDIHIKSYLEEGEVGFLKTFLCYEDKSSGFSARYRNMKKSAWVTAHPEEVVDLTLSRLVLLVVAGRQLEELGAIELIKHGCSDAKEIFMKPEGHSPQKTEEGRFRLIWISSLIDLTVQAMLHKADNAAHVDAYQEGQLTCAALGMGHSPEGLKHLVRAFQAEGVAHSNVSSDASAFDLSIDGSFIHEDGARRADNCADLEVSRLVKRYAHVLCSHVLNNQGDIWLVLKYGVTTSGQLSTTTQNTFARSVMAAYGGCTGWTCAGDDLVGDENFDQRRLLHFGVRSRDVEEHEDEADFTSHLIDTMTSKAVFCNVEKLLWHLHSTCIDVSANRERFGANLYILRDTPGVLEDMTSLASEFGINTDGYVAESSLMRDLA